MKQRSRVKAQSSGQPSSGQQNRPQRFVSTPSFPSMPAREQGLPVPGDVGGQTEQIIAREYILRKTADQARRILTLMKMIADLEWRHGDEPQMLTEQAARLRTKWLETIEEEEDRQLVREQWDFEIEKARQRTEARFWQREREEATKTFLETHDYLLERASKAAGQGDQESAHLYQTHGDHARQIAFQYDLISADDYVAMGEKEVNQMTDAHIWGQFEREKLEGPKAVRQFITTIQKPGFLPVSQWDKIKKKLQDGLKQYEKEQAFLAAKTHARAVYSGEDFGDRQDPLHRQATDSLWQEIRQNSHLSGVPVGEQNRQAADFVARMGFIPESMAGDLRRASLGSVETQMAASDLVTRLDALPGNLLKGILSAPTQAKMALMRDMVKAGQPPEIALKKATEMTDPTDYNQRKNREDRLREILQEAAITAKEVTDYDAEGQTGDLKIPAKIQARIEADSQAMFKQQYLLTGDEDMARDYAMQKLARVWREGDLDDSGPVLLPDKAKDLTLEGENNKKSPG